MRIQNIMALADALERVGLPVSMGRRLLQHICLMPDAFSLKEQVVKEKDLLLCSFFFRRSGEDYACSYYEVSLLKGMDLPDKVIESIHLPELDERMSGINWRFEEEDSRGFDPKNEESWKREKEIEGVVRDLAKLSRNEEGSYFADFLKLKHWSGIAHSLPGSLASLRSRFEISQRFYFMNEAAVSIEEAYRFLLNRWMEKQQTLIKKRTTASGEKPGLKKRRHVKIKSDTGKREP